MKEIVKCDLCNADLKLIETKEVKGTRYHLLECDHCKKMVAKRVD